MAKTQESFGRSECNRVKQLILCIFLNEPFRQILLYFCKSVLSHDVNVFPIEHIEGGVM